LHKNSLKSILFSGLLTIGFLGTGFVGEVYGSVGEFEKKILRKINKDKLSQLSDKVELDRKIFMKELGLSEKALDNLDLTFKFYSPGFINKIKGTEIQINNIEDVQIYTDNITDNDKEKLLIPTELGHKYSDSFSDRLYKTESGTVYRALLHCHTKSFQNLLAIISLWCLFEKNTVFNDKFPKPLTEQDGKKIADELKKHVNCSDVEVKISNKKLKILLSKKDSILIIMNTEDIYEPIKMILDTKERIKKSKEYLE